MISADFNPYHVLDIPLTATKQEILQKYRQLCVKYHPDMTGASTQASTDTFALITQAKNMLIGNDTDTARSKCPPVNITFEVKLRDFFTNPEHTITYTVDDNGVECTRSVQLRISTLFCFDQKVIFEHAGNVNKACEAGDLHINIVRAADDKYSNFFVDNNNLIYTQKLPLSSMLQYNFTIEHPSGKRLKINGGPLTECKQLLIYENYGMPISDESSKASESSSGSRNGSLIIILSLDIHGLQTLDKAKQQSVIQFLKSNGL